MTDNANEDEPRIKRELSVARRPRETEDRNTTENRGLGDDRAATENREISEDERVEMFRMQNYNDQLPNLPAIPGWHICWLTTANPRDSIQSRMRLGYEPVKREDIPGADFDLMALKTGDYAGLIGINEMVAFKLPESLYQRFMREVHHDEPLRQERMIVDQMDSMREQAESLGGKLIEGDGMSALREAAPRVKAFS